MKPSAEELFGPAATPRVVAVGTGFGGIAAGVKLKQAGIDTFTIYESARAVNGEGFAGLRLTHRPGEALEHSFRTLAS